MYFNEKLAIIGCLLFIFGCGDALVDGGYRGDVLFSLEGSLNRTNISMAPT